MVRVRFHTDRVPELLHRLGFMSVSSCVAMVSKLIETEGKLVIAVRISVSSAGAHTPIKALSMQRWSAIKARAA